jgi:energy-coupling factor transporter transmembrane protein EcfT
MIEKEDKVLLGFSIAQCVVCFSVLTYVLYKNKCKFNAVLIIFFSVYSLVFLLMLSTNAFIVIHRNNDKKLNELTPIVLSLEK